MINHWILSLTNPALLFGQWRETKMASTLLKDRIQWGTQQIHRKHVIASWQGKRQGYYSEYGVNMEFHHSQFLSQVAQWHACHRDQWIMCWGSRKPKEAFQCWQLSQESSRMLANWALPCDSPSFLIPGSFQTTHLHCICRAPFEERLRSLRPCLRRTRDEPSETQERPDASKGEPLKKAGYSCRPSSDGAGWCQLGKLRNFRESNDDSHLPTHL